MGFFCGGGGEQLEHEVNHAPPNTAKIRDAQSYTTTSAVCLHGTDIENLTFTYIREMNDDRKCTYQLLEDI